LNLKVLLYPSKWLLPAFVTNLLQMAVLSLQTLHSFLKNKKSTLNFYSVNSSLNVPTLVFVKTPHLNLMVSVRLVLVTMVNVNLLPIPIILAKPVLPVLEQTHLV